MMNKHFSAAEHREKIKALPLSDHNAKLEMELWHGVLGELRKVTTTLVEPIVHMEHVGSMDMEPTEQEI